MRNPKMKNPRIKDPRIENPMIEDPRIKDPRIEDPGIKDPVHGLKFCPTANPSNHIFSIYICKQYYCAIFGTKKKFECG